MTSETPPTPHRKSFWKKAALPIGVLAIAGIGGTLWARKFIYEDIVPIVQDSLQKELNRPVKIGKIEAFGLSSLKIGKSEIPATAKDSDHAEIDAIEVKFDIWEAIQRKKLKIKVDLLNPMAFLEEDKPGVWVGTEIAQKKDDDYAGDVEVAEIKLSNATLELLPIAKTPKETGSSPKEKQQPRKSVKLQKVNTTIEVFDRGKNLKISSIGESAAQGTFDIKAEVWNRTGDATAAKPAPKTAAAKTKSTSDQSSDSKPSDSKPSGSKPSNSKPATQTLSLDINGEVRTQKMLLSEVDRLARLPVNVESGELSSNLNLQVRTNEKYPSLKGTATFRDIAAKAPGVAYGVSKVEGDLRFDGQKITLEKSKALVAKTIDVNTSGTIDLKDGINLTAKTNSVAIPKLIKAFDVKSPVTIAGEILTEVNITGPIETPRISGQVKNTKPIAITPPPQTPKSDKPLPDLRLTTVLTKFTVDPKTTKLGITSLSVIPELGGSITGSGTVALAKPESIDLQLQATGLDADKLAQVYTGQALPIKAGTVAANINISGSPTAPKTFVAWKAPDAQYPASGEVTIVGTSAGTTLITLSNTTAQLEGGTARIAGTINDGKLALNLKTDGLPLKPLSPELRGNFSSDLDIAGNLENLSPETIRIAGSTRLSEGVAIVNDPIVAQIEWTGQQLNIKEATAPGLFVNGTIVPRLGDKPDIASIDLNVKTQGFSLASIPPELSNGVKLSGTTDSDLKITGNLSDLSVLGDLSLNSVNVNTNAIAAIPPSKSTSETTTARPSAPNITARLNLAFNGLQVNDLKIDPLRGTVAYGTNQGVDINLAGRRDRIAAKLDQNFQPISANLRRGDGTLDAVRSGNGLNVAMRTIDLGELNGFGLEKPLTQILAQAGAADEIGTPTLGGQLNGNLTIDLNNQQLQSGNVQIDRLRFGNVRATNLIATVQNGNLRNQSIASASVVINQLESPKLTAQSLRANVQNVNLASGAISGAIVEINQPQLLGTTATQIVANLGPGNFKTGQSGTLVVTQPRVGREEAQDLNAAFFVSSTQFNLQKSTLRLPLKDDRGRLTGEIGTLALRGSLNFQGDPKVEAEMDVINGQFQDVLRTVQLFSISDVTRAAGLAGQGVIPLPQYDSAADVQPNAIGDANAPVLKQLKRFAEINQIIAQTAETRSTTVMPTSLDIRGRFNGKVKIAGALNRPDRLNASFKMTANTLEWRPYSSYLTTNNNKLETNVNRVLKAENAVLEGGIENGVLSVRPFLLKSGDTTIRLSSVQLGEVDQPSGQLKVENLPVEAIQDFIPYPLDLAGSPISLAGNLNGTITLSGERNKPNFVGFVNLANGSLNSQPIQSAVGSFNYEDGRIKFKNTVVANSSEPIAIVGELPYDLDLPILGKSLSPDRSFKITGRVKDDGLSILNMLGQPIEWQGGKGQLNFDVSSGSGQPLKVQGELLLDGATIKAQALPESLTNVRGRVTADFSGINVQELRGEFSRGQVVASGSIPLFGYAPTELPEEAILTATNPATPATPTPATPANNKPKPLLVDLQKLSINLKGLYQGNVNGRMVIGGSALDPKIGGNITLTDGRVSLEDAPPSDLLPGSKTNGRPPFELRNLKLRLGDNIRVVRAPILNFVARGDLEVTGTLDKLQPKGRIDLNAGQVNLFTTQFVLARGYRNFAEFRPEMGLDPNLDVRLLTAVPEVSRTRIPTNNVTSEISQGLNLSGNVGGVQTIRIQARVEGPASRLTQNLELKSSPSRSSSEIVSLLGGGFVNTLGRGDDATLGIANFAGSALLTNVQGVIGNAIGLSEFRLFPTLIGNSSNQTSTLGLAAEAGIDLIRTTDGLPVVSATALRVLTAPNQTTQFGLRYRINEQLLFRGSTDFSGDNRAVFEFEGRF